MSQVANVSPGGPGSWNGIGTGICNGGTAYYVANGGSDAANGKTPATAWQTISHVNSQVFNAGDSVLFNGGQTFSGGLVLTATTNPNGSFTVGAYGAGTPVISSGNSTAGLTATNLNNIAIQNINFTGGRQRQQLRTDGVYFLKLGIVAAFRHHDQHRHYHRLWRQWRIRFVERQLRLQQCYHHQSHGA